MRPGQSDWTRRYFRDRDLVAGRRWWISQDPAVAAEQLVRLLHSTGRARRWAVDLLAAIEQKRAA